MKSLLDSLKESLSAPRNDGMLHFSQHLQHDRHAAIYMKYGYPQTAPAWGRLFPLVQGTGVHETIHTHMSKICEQYLPEHEIFVKSGLQYQWTGSVDAFAKYDNDYWLLDYKTISGAGMFFLGDEPKPDHVWQVSAYHAFRPESKQSWRTAVIYLPSSPDYKRNWEEPRMIEFTPYSREKIIERMQEVEEHITLYAETGFLPPGPSPSWRWRAKGKTWHLEQRPHYTSMFCPWGSLADDPCGCSEQELISIARLKDDKLTIEDGYDIIVEQVIADIGVPDES